MKEIRATHSFQELHELLRSICNNIAGLGELCAYDTALRLGAFMGFEPEYVYPHAGTRAGARALGIDTSRHYVGVDEFPELLQQLPAYELEDILCIYKDRFRESAN